MIGSIVRSVGAIIVGFILSMFFIVGVEGLWSIIYPFPPGVDPSDLDACKAHVAELPAGAFMLASTGWGLGTFLSSWLATRLGSGRHIAHGIVVGSILLAAAIANMLMLPYPIWFWGLNLIVFPVGCYVGAKLAQARSSNRRKAAAEPDAAPDRGGN